MTTEKVQAKIKSSTIAIIVLSILLAIAVTSSIVLAAFSASREFSTTISFGNSLDLKLSNAGNADFAANAASKGTITIVPTSGHDSAANGFAKDVELGAISAETNQKAYVGFQIVVKSNTNDQKAGATTFATTDGKTFKSGDMEVVFTPGVATVVEDKKTNGIWQLDNSMDSEFKPKELFSNVKISSTDTAKNGLAGNRIFIEIKFKAETVDSKPQGPSSVTTFP